MRYLIVGLAVVAGLYSFQADARGSGGGHSSSGSHSGSGHVNPSSHSVSGYTKRNGTHVHSYRATDPNSTQRDNYSAKGNVNPYTGKKGTKRVTH